MVEIFCVIEDRANDDFLFLLQRHEGDAVWRGLAVESADGESVPSSLAKALGKNAASVSLLRSWPLCDREPARGAPETWDGIDRRHLERGEINHVGAEIDGDIAAALTADGFAVVPFEDGLDLVSESDRRVLTLARQGAWIHKARELEA